MRRASAAVPLIGLAACAPSQSQLTIGPPAAPRLSVTYRANQFSGIHIEGGCRTDFEAYLALADVYVDPIEGVAPPTPAPRDRTPPRATVTYYGAR